MALLNKGLVEHLLRNSRLPYTAGWLLFVNSQPLMRSESLSDLNWFINKARAEAGLKPLITYYGSCEYAQMMPVEMLTVPEDTFLPRKFDAQYIEGIFKAYARDPLEVNPLRVKITHHDGQIRLSVLDGTLRYIALMLAKKQGASIEAIPVVDIDDYR